MTSIHIEKPLLILIGLIISAAVAFFYYYKDKKFDHISRLWIYLMATLRFVAIFLLFLLLANPLIKSTLKIKQKPIIVLLQDNTKSIPLATDSLYITDYLRHLNSLIKNLKQKFDVRLFTFSDSLRQNHKIDFSGNYTNISQAIYDINQRFLNQNLGAIILASDGIYNQGFDPEFQASQSQVPIFALALGDTTEYADIKINNLRTNSIVFLHEKFPLQAEINALHAAGKKASITVRLNGRLVAKKIITINKDYFRKKVNFILRSPSPGKKLLTVSISRLRNERNTLNNTRTTVIEVIDSRQKILILSRFPHPDIATLRRSLQAIPTYKIDFSLVNKFKGNLKDYALIILYQLPDSKTNITALKKQLQASGKPVLIILGSKTDPIKLQNLGTGLEFNPIVGSMDQAQASVNKDFYVFLLDKGLQNTLNSLPPLIVPYLDYQNIDKQYVMLWQKVNGIITNKPLIIFIPASPLNNNKLGIICGEGIWRWRITEFRNTKSFYQTDKLISQIVQFLMTNSRHKRFDVKVRPVIDQNQEVIFSAQLYDKTYAPITEPDVKLTISDSSGNILNYVFEKSTDYYTLDIGKLREGIYHYTATCSLGKENFIATGSFAVRKVNMEAIDLRANTQLLEKIASQSGGQFFFADQTKQLETELLNNNQLPKLIITQTQTRQGIKYYIFLILVLVSLTAEWVLRKYFGNL